MARKSANTPTGVQNYPRIEGGDYDSCLDDTTLVPHTTQFSEERLHELIHRAINDAAAKSRRQTIDMPPDADELTKNAIYQKAGRELFKYFKDNCSDPASATQQLQNRDCREVAQEQFRLTILQKERMNSAWRYQYLALYAARASQRFESVSDVNQTESDFTATIHFRDYAEKPKDNLPLNIFVSVKNRENTHGGQDWPKAISALEQAASTDKNMRGRYLCVFAFAMDGDHKNSRRIRRNKEKKAFSLNTEMWYADFFWPFFANFSYESIMKATFDVLSDVISPDQFIGEVVIPSPVSEVFASECSTFGLVDSAGKFNDPYKLVHFFCNPLPRRAKKGQEK